MPGRFPPPVRSSLLAFAAGLTLGAAGLWPAVGAGTARAAAAAEPEPAPTAPCSEGGVNRVALVCEINAVRAAAGLGALQPRPSLAAAALGHAADMVAHGYFAHYAPGGAGPVTRVRRAGYLKHAKRWRIGETLLWRRGGTPLTAADAVAAWLGSPPHRRVLLSPRYEDIGAGVVPGAPLGDPAVGPAATLVVEFGRRR